MAFFTGAVVSPKRDRSGTKANCFPPKSGLGSWFPEARCLPPFVSGNPNQIRHSRYAQPWTGRRTRPGHERVPIETSSKMRRGPERRDSRDRDRVAFTPRPTTCASRAGARTSSNEASLGYLPQPARTAVQLDVRAIDAAHLVGPQRVDETLTRSRRSQRRRFPAACRRQSGCHPPGS